MKFRSRVLRIIFPIALLGAIVLFSGEWLMWKTSDTYPAALAQSVTLQRPADVTGNTLIDAKTVEGLCHDAAPGPDVSQKASGLFVRCGSPLLRQNAIYRVEWENK